MRCVIWTSLATKAWGEFALGANLLPGNAHDCRMLEEQLDQIVRFSVMVQKRCHLDHGYITRLSRIGCTGSRGPLPPERRGTRARVRGQSANLDSCRGMIAGNRQDSITNAIKKEVKRRSETRPEVGQQYTVGKPGSPWLKDVLGEPQNSILYAVRHNTRKNIAHPMSPLCQHLALTHRSVKSVTANSWRARILRVRARITFSGQLLLKFFLR